MNGLDPTVLMTSQVAGAGFGPVPGDTYMWGIVTGVSPLQVQIDGDSASVGGGIPLASVNVGQRVWCQFHRPTGQLIVHGPGTRALTAPYVQRLLSGGGLKAMSSTGISWSGSFITVAGLTSGVLAPSGYYQIDMPADGTIISVYGKTGTSTAIVASGTIPLATRDVLWYELPIGTDNTSKSANFRITSYTATMDVVPPHWIFLCLRNSDPGAHDYTWGDGHREDYWHDITTVTNGFTDPINAQYHMINGEVHLRGALLHSSTTALTTACTLPVNYRPGVTVMFPMSSNTATTMYGQVLTDGSLQTYTSAATASWRPLGACRYPPEG